MSTVAVGTGAVVDRSLRDEVLEGLRRSPKILPTKLLYDARGARLFGKITQLEEYYLTRTELDLLRDHVSSVAGLAGPAVRVVEPGSGSGEKTRLLLDALDRPSAYVPVDIASGQLSALARELRAEHPAARISPVVADYTRPFRLPEGTDGASRTLVFFPGSTIGNFEPAGASEFLKRMGGLAGPGGMLLLGADLAKPANVVEPAYNDRMGVTAEFNLNVLRHLNRVLGTDFRLERFRHRAPWDPERSRVEMRLVSLRDQRVLFPETPEGDAVQLSIRKGEFIVTERSYKYTAGALDGLITAGGWVTLQDWRDRAGWFSVRLLGRRGSRPDA
jgi:dimethylhistidine N-methyltransferase